MHWLAWSLHCLKYACMLALLPYYAGFRLGDREGPSEVVGNPTAAVRPPQNVEYTLMFWKNGFSVNDGPLRDGQSPEDQMFLQSVSRGQVYPSLYTLNFLFAAFTTINTTHCLFLRQLCDVTHIHARARNFLQGDSEWTAVRSTRRWGQREYWGQEDRALCPTKAQAGGLLGSRAQAREVSAWLSLDWHSSCPACL